MYAPIIIFAFNRPYSLRNTIDSLALNPESKDSNLFIFIDGPRDDTEKSLTDETAKTAYSISETDSFKSVIIKVSDVNKGLGDSIIAGVTEVIDKFGRVIVLEDDLKLQPNFLAFMNDGLEKYAHDGKVFSICGYTNKVRIPKDYPYDAYLCTRSSSWGWATWKDRWQSVNWNPNPNDSTTNAANLSFNKWGGSDCQSMLEGWRKGFNRSWAIRFCFSQYLQDKLSVFPIKSLVENEGFDGAGTNCKKWSRFRYELMDPAKKNFSFPPVSKMLPHFHRESLKYHSIPRRLYSRLMYMIYR